MAATLVLGCCFQSLPLPSVRDAQMWGAGVGMLDDTRVTITAKEVHTSTSLLTSVALHTHSYSSHPVPCASYPTTEQGSHASSHHRHTLIDSEPMSG